MRRTLTFLALMLGVFLAAPAWALEDAATCGITATVDEIVEWDGNVTILASDFSAHITSAKDTTGITATKAMTLYYNVNVNIVPSDATNSGVLTSGASGTLTTTYKLTGADMTNPDSSWVASGTFIGKSYAQTHTAGDGDCVITVNVKAATGASGPGACPDAGNYSTTITLTATKAL